MTSIVGEPPKHITPFSVRVIGLNSVDNVDFDKLPEKLGNDNTKPMWLDALQKNNPEPFGKGGTKQLYKVNGMAISLEIGPKEFVERRKYTIQKVEEALNSVPKDQRRVIVGKEIHEIILTEKISALYSLLDLCEKDLNNMNMQFKGDYTEQVVSLARCIEALHKNRMYLVDIKPANMLFCKDIIHLTDVEDVVFENEQAVGATQTFSKEIYEALFMSSKEHSFQDIEHEKKMALVDWCAFSTSMQVLDIYWQLKTFLTDAIDASGIACNKITNFDNRWDTKKDVLEKIKEVFQGWEKVTKREVVASPHFSSLKL